MVEMSFHAVNKLNERLIEQTNGVKLGCSGKHQFRVGECV
jgi:hypothetical protein